MLSVSKQFLFIHPTKSAGNAIKSALKEYSAGRFEITRRYPDGAPLATRIASSPYRLTYKHHTLRDYRARIPKPLFDRLFKFSVIRNPWERAIEVYFGRYARWNKKRFTRDARYLRTLRRMICYDCSRKPVEWLRRRLHRPPGPRAAPLDADIDFLIRYEHLDEDFAALCRRLDLPEIKLPHLETVRHAHKHYRFYYDAELVDFIRMIFAEEIAFGGYVFD